MPRRPARRSPRSPRSSANRVEEAALAIARIADNNMVGALRTVLIEQGLDPRDFTLCRLRRRRAAACQRPDERDGNPARHRAQFTRPVLGLRLHHGRCPRRPAPDGAAQLDRFFDAAPRQRAHGRAGGRMPGRARSAGPRRRHRSPCASRCAISARTTSWRSRSTVDSFTDEEDREALGHRSTSTTRRASASRRPASSWRS